MREILIAMAPNVHVPPQHLLNEFDRLVPDLLATAEADFPFIASPEKQKKAKPRLMFEHSCK